MARRLSNAAIGGLHDLMAGHVARGDVPGVVTLVGWRGETHVDAIGVKTVGYGDPIRRDSIFRLSSMTKPITAAAAMILVDEGLLELDEPVDRLLPELADRRVLNRLDGSLDDTVPAHRPISVRDVLTFRIGFGALTRPPNSVAIQKAVGALELMTGAPPKPATPHAPDEWLRRFGTLPLMHQPGETWMYDTAAHVLGVLIARAAGQPLEAFLRERIFDPLDMKDTGFRVPADKRDRLVSCYQFSPLSKALELHDGIHDSQWNQPPAFPDAAGGLVSTADDYLAFAQMLLEHGRHGRQRILSPASVDAMTTNHLTHAQQAAARDFLDDAGWGFGLSVLNRPDGLPPRYGWDGAYGTSWSSAPDERAIAILMTQRLVFPVSSGVERDFREAVWNAIGARTT